MSQSKKLEPIHAEVIAFLWLVCLGGKVLDGQIILGTSTVRASPVYIGKLGTLRSPFVQRCLTYCFLQNVCLRQETNKEIVVIAIVKMSKSCGISTKTWMVNFCCIWKNEIK